jgi:hypothetical protein
MVLIKEMTRMYSPGVIQTSSVCELSRSRRIMSKSIPWLQVQRVVSEAAGLMKAPLDLLRSMAKHFTQIGADIGVLRPQMPVGGHRRHSNRR